MKSVKRAMAIVLSACILLATAACGTSTSASSAVPAQADVSQQAAARGGKVGVAMPTKSSERWIRDGNNMKDQLEKLGYTVDLQYAEDDVQAQVSQDRKSVV